MVLELFFFLLNRELDLFFFLELGVFVYWSYLIFIGFS